MAAFPLQLYTIAGTAANDGLTFIKVASAGNRTRAARVAGEHSTTEPPMLNIFHLTQKS